MKNTKEWWSSVCVFHKWEKWQQYEAIKFTMKYGEKIEFIEPRQKRVCENCGKMEDEKIIWI